MSERSAIAERLAQLPPEKRDLLRRQLEERRAAKGASLGYEPIALVGIGCRFAAGVEGPESFWRLLREGVDGVTEVPRERFDLEAVYHPEPGTPGKTYSRWGSFLDRVDGFDPAFFRLTPREAAAMDPQQRLLLEVAWEALEEAGLAADRLVGSRTGVFVGLSTGDYATLIARSGDLSRFDGFFGTGNALSVAAGRIAYTFGFEGPAVALDTACSSSLVAVHLACQSLRARECDLALAGGVNLILAPEVTIYSSQIRVLAADGRCKSFDERADGYVRGEGCGVVALRRLADALAEGDRIHAVVRGSAVNQDGRSSGLTAPNGPAQQRVIRAALEAAGVSPGEIDLVEAHGSGTALGDPIEALALGAALRDGRPPGSRVAVGSVKTNLGHLEAAAGAAGLIKAALALEHGEIPPSLHFRRPNPEIPFDRLPLEVPVRLRPWPEHPGRPRRAGVSSFGFSGTNAHVVLEQAPERPSGPSQRPHQVLVVSAASAAALEVASDRLAAHLEAHPELPIADLAFTSQMGRRAFACRRAVVAATVAEAAEALAARHPRKVASGQAGPGALRPVFLFPGVGDQYPGMGRGLYHSEPVFREQIDRAAELARPRLGFDLREALGLEQALPPAQRPEVDLRRLLGRGRVAPEPAEERLARTAVAHPVLFALEHALAELWASRGVVPRALLGYSLGEYVAACRAGVLSFEDALAVVIERSRLLEALPPGALLAVPLPEAVLRERLPPELALAAVTAPERVIVAGEPEAVAAFREALGAEGVICPQVTSAQAFHSPAVAPAAAELARLMAQVELSPPRIPYLSNLTGDWVQADQARDPHFWARQMCQTVRFSAGLEVLLREGESTFVEVGPGQTLTVLVRQQAAQGEPLAVASLPYAAEGVPDTAFFAASLARLWAAGAAIDWRGAHTGESRRRVALPTYPFERQRCWLAEPAVAEPAFAEPQPAPPELPMVDLAVASSSPATPASRRPALLAQVLALIEKVLGLSAETLDHDKPFLEMGADSIALAAVAAAIEERFGLQIAIRQFFEELTTLSELVSHLDAQLPAEVLEPAAQTVQARPAAPPPPAPVAVMSPSVAPAAVPLPQPAVTGAPEDLLARQLAAYTQGFNQVVSQQLAWLGGKAVAEEPAASPAPTTASPLPDAKVSKPAAAAVFVPYQPVQREAGTELSARQRAHLDSLIRRYTARTAASKRWAERYRGVLADSRGLTGFRPATKELVYPLVAEWARGARIRDLDGNDYLDITMGFGVHLFGHSPAFLETALARRLERGLGLGPRAEDAGRAAELLCRLTGHDRASFFATGTEAVMAAVRLARAATGRSQLAMFAGSYHGQGDATLVRPSLGGESPSGVPVAPGILAATAAETLVLDWAEPSSLAQIERHAGGLAAVLVEPVQSRRPGLQPRDFLLELRRLTERLGILLIFDEMITGLRAAPGGAQELFGVRADLATYGKILGGGLPVGAVAGRAEVMAGVDGGIWRFGDASFPPGNTTFLGGTHCHHPLAMSAAVAILTEVERRGPALQLELSERMSRLGTRLNRSFEATGAPLRLAWFASQFRFETAANVDLFFYHLIEKGLYAWELRNFFLSTAHDEADLERIAVAVEESIAELQDGGFFPEGPGGGRRQPAPPVPAGAVAAAPLSETQRQIWLASQLGAAPSTAYTESLAVALDGPFSARSFYLAWRCLGHRHEALRTVMAPGGETQWVLPSPSAGFALIDLSGLPATRRHGEAAGLLARAAGARLDLERGPLFRLAFLHAEPEAHTLVLSGHHLVVDGWSIGVFLEELAELYSGLEEGRVVTLPPTSTLRAYAAAQARGLEGPEAERLQGFWRAYLGQGLSPLALPADHPRPPRRTFAGARHRALLDPELTAALRGLARGQGATLFMTLLALWSLLLSRLTGQRALVVGIPSAGRGDSANARLVGSLADLLPVRLDLRRGLDFAGLLAEVRRRLLDAYEHDGWPFGRLLADLAGQRDPSRAPLIETFFNLDRPVHVPALHGLESRALEIPLAATKLDLSLNVIDRGETLLLELDRSRELFEATSAERWLASFVTLTRSAIADPRLPLGVLDGLAAEERRQILGPWAGEVRQAPGGPGLAELFQAQAARAPEAVAIESDGELLSYGELARRAGRRAAGLAALGVGPEVAVAVCLERSPALAENLLAVTLAGGFYLPLDRGHPPERLAFLLEDSGAALLVAGGDLVQLPGPRRVTPSELAALGEGAPAVPPIAGAGGHLAYLIYTSGSTGQPKGVAVLQEGVVRLIRNADYLTFSPGVRIGQVSNAAFDAYTFELWGALANGGTLVVIEPEAVLDPVELGQALARHAVREAFLTTQLFHRQCQEAPEALAGLSTLCFGGEACDPRLVAEAAVAPWRPRRLLNAYGPTECTTFATWHEVRAGERGPVPIGRPIASTTAAILDDELRPAGIGIEGELFLGGPGLARGYWRRPGLTAERFLPSPAGPAGARVYRTGDRARWRPDGAVEYLGRRDGQVKIRGHRIEVGEVEAALAALPGVAGAAVLVRESSGSGAGAMGADRRLVAYVVPEPGSEPSAAALGEELAQRLPRYLVPSAVIFLPRLPLTPNGKLDRRALPEPEEVRGGEGEAPRPGLEEWVAGVFRDLLGVAEVGRES
ncbi:MAG TPA: amino acid adenylation domain-containing protein, partial [Thermoanaerobaculia bacterium]|nr:amino acid adenylation domain-containing protein [Thermoanaerobaculia bacterium]